MSPVVKCVACNENIDGKIISAMGNTYHPDHFTCHKCKVPIKGDKFQVKDGLPYCDADYEKEFLSNCYACHQPIRERLIKAMGHNWHEHHFICNVCRKELASVNFIVKEGNPMCQECYNSNYAEKCKGCGKSIVEKVILALNEKWHPECFKCIKCSQPVTEDSFQVENERPICSKCS